MIAVADIMSNSAIKLKVILFFMFMRLGIAGRVLSGSGYVFFQMVLPCVAQRNVYFALATLFCAGKPRRAHNARHRVSVDVISIGYEVNTLRSNCAGLFFTVWKSGIMHEVFDSGRGNSAQ
ncbi:MAG: hypothetical protein ACYCYR_16690 [Desulfobulbaceae bacterium]